MDIDWAALGVPVVVYLAVTAGPGMELSQIISAIRELPETQDMSVVTGGLDLLVRLRVRDQMHLRDLLLNSIFQIPGVQRTETFLSLADVEPANFAAALLDQMAERTARPRHRCEGRTGDRSSADPGGRRGRWWRRRRPAGLRRQARPADRRAGRGGAR